MISPDPQNHPVTSPESTEEWQWPVDLASYQRTPLLWERALQELDQVMTGRALPPVLPLPLQHVLYPVQDVLEVSHANPRMRHDVRRVLLLEMHRRRSS